MGSRFGVRGMGLKGITYSAVGITFKQRAAKAAVLFVSAIFFCVT